MSRFVILAAFLHFSRNNKFHYPYVNTLLNAQTHTNAVTDTHIHALMCNCITVSLALCWRACTYAAACVCVFFFQRDSGRRFGFSFDFGFASASPLESHKIAFNLISLRFFCADLVIFSATLLLLFYVIPTFAFVTCTLAHTYNHISA